MYPDAPSRVGKEQIQAGMKPAFDNYTLRIVIGKDPEVRVFGELGFMRGIYTLTMIPKAGGETINYDGKYLTILEKQANGSWKILRDCFNSNVPP
jgi:ketosteroid isomerase-like protein